MTVSHGQQAEFRFSGKKGNSGSEEESRKKDKRKRIKAKGKPEKTGDRRRRRVESVEPETAQKAEKQNGKASITFPLRLSSSEHAEWRDFASKKRFSLHQFIKNSVDDVLSRIRQGESISWIKIG